MVKGEWNICWIATSGVMVCRLPACKKVECQHLGGYTIGETRRRSTRYTFSKLGEADASLSKCSSERKVSDLVPRSHRHRIIIIWNV